MNQQKKSIFNFSLRGTVIRLFHAYLGKIIDSAFYKQHKLLLHEALLSQTKHFLKSFSYMNLQRHIQVLAVFQQICPIFHNTCWILFSRQGCLNERPGCREDFATEFLNCLRSIQRRSIMSIRSPRKSPTYKLRFQPQPSAKGSEVDATRNFLGAGMGLGSNPPSPAPPKMPFPYTQGLDRCPVAVGAIVEAGIQEVYVIQFPSVPMVLSSNQWSRPVERASTVFELSILLTEMVEIFSAAVLRFPSAVRLLAQRQPPNLSFVRGGGSKRWL